MSPPAIEVDGVSKRFRLVKGRNNTLKGTIFNGFKRTEYEELWALRDVSFEVAEGSTFALVGHNGSGKSTMLKCLTHIYRPDRGSIGTRGVVSALLELGAGFHPELSGRENVYLNASILGLGRKEVDRRFDEIVGFAGLEKHIDSPVKNYSSGQFVRLGFAVAINVEPDILLVDEVLAVGDEEFQRRCLAKFAEFRASGRTVVLVSHGMDNVRKLCDRAILLDHGRAVTEGPALDVVAEYLRRVDVPDDERVAHLPGWSVAVPRVLDDRGQLVAEIGTGGSVTFSSTIELDRPGEAELRFGLLGPGGAHVGRVARQVRVDRPGPIQVQLRSLALPLVAGEYELHARLFDLDGIERAAPEVATRFVVTDDDAGGHAGPLRIDGRWSTEAAGSPPA